MYHATLAGAEDTVKELMARIENSIPSYSSDAAWKPPLEWSMTEQGIVDLTRDLLEQTTANDSRCTISPVI